MTSKLGGNKLAGATTEGALSVTQMALKQGQISQNDYEIIKRLIE